MSGAESTWTMTMAAERFSDTGLSNTLRLQYKTYQSTKHMGERLPVALEPGEKPIKPFIFRDGAEMVEKEIGKLISMRG